MRKRHNVVSKKKPTEGEMRQRMKWRNLMALWGLFNDELHPSFEPLGPGETDYSRFLKANAHLSTVYLTKAMADENACVLPQIIVTQGSLRTPVEYKRDGDKMVTNIALGDLVIDENTTVAQFAFAVLNNNTGRYGRNDYLGFFLGRQGVNAATSFPTATVKGQRVKLDLECNLKLWEVTGKAGFQTVNGCLGTPYEALCLYAWVRLMETVEGRMMVSCQQMVGDNTMVALYSTEAAFTAAADSYGGYKNRYLTPFKNRPLTGNLTEPGTTPGGGTTQQQVVITTAVSPTGAGTVTGGGTYAPGTEVTLTATATDAATKPFTKWSDGVTQNPRTVTATTNAVYTALFGTQGGGDDGMIGG